MYNVHCTYIISWIHIHVASEVFCVLSTFDLDFEIPKGIAKCLCQNKQYQVADLSKEI